MLSDMEGMTGCILLLCLISVTHANYAPDINTLFYQVCEDTPPGQHAFIIDATDKDNDPLTFTLTGLNAAYFTVDRNTGSVTVRRRLDREVSEVMNLDVIVSDGVNNRDAELTVLLLEANDNRPIFVESSYDFAFPESTSPGTSLFRVQATDEDTLDGGIVKYSIDEVTPSDGLALFSIVATSGEVRLNGQLNYLKNNLYRLKINATDGGGKCYYPETNYFSSIAFSFVTVTDVADLDPTFISLPYIGRVEEHSPVDLSVFEVTAIDPDTGVNDAMIYSIEDSTETGLFKISPNDGVISVLSEIDREVVGDTVTLTVKATESQTNIHGYHANTTASVQINILDINDQTPEFYKCEDLGDESSCVRASQFTGEVVEHSLSPISFNMLVKDLDMISRTELILEGEDKDVFSVEPPFAVSDSIVQLVIRKPQALDYEEKQQMLLQVIAVDTDATSLRSTATVTINIQDANDNSPKFPQGTYKLTVAEHSPFGTILATITAEDPDTMDQGNLTYRLLPESMLQYFDVESHTGTVYVKNETLLDREARSLYSGTLQAVDTDGKPGTTILEITLTDINDQPPVINRDSYLEFVEEGRQLEVKIEATDADEPGTPNSQIVFAIVPSSANFTIDPNTGVLRNSGELDREALDPDLNGKIELTVTATDKGTPPLTTNVTVIINVEDVNDNKPQFDAPSYRFFVKEGEKGAFVGSVHAEDLDQTTVFNRISFSIIDGSAGSFIIRSFAEARGYRGSIAVDVDIELDYESIVKPFTLMVEAADLEQERAEVMVTVEVLDVNDERPEFQPVTTEPVKENTTISEPVGKFIATDKDGNHSLVYELVSVKCRCNNSETLTPCNWFILDPTGDVRINPKYTLDYEECDEGVIEAQVVDEFTEKGENNSVTSGQMVIKIEDINDNAPEFIFSDSVFVVVSESASKDTSVAGVTATDRDSGVNRQIEFRVTEVQFKDMKNQTSTMRMLFEAVTTQQKDNYVGIIQTTEALDKTLRGKYLVSVTATDTGGLSSSTVLEIFTVDESYKVELEFLSSVAEVEGKRPEIIRALTSATKATVVIIKMREVSNEARATLSTIIEVYFVYANGTALTSKEVEKMVSVPEHFSVLVELGLRNIGQAPVEEQKVDPVKYALMGMVGGLIIVLAVLATSLMCTRRSYRRKLKAAKAMNSASMVNSDNQKSGPVVPGTNKYTMEGANPVLNLMIDTAMVLDLDGESSDVDKVSLNSLDYSDNMTIPEEGTKPSMDMIQEEEDSGPPEYIEPLGAALAQRSQKTSSDKSRVGYSNPAFDTTDL